MSDTAYLDSGHTTCVADGVELIASQFISASDVQEVIAADGDLVELLLDVADVTRDITSVDIDARRSSLTRVRCWP
jgi:hypothetical protein